MVTVVVSVYNTADYLAKCLDSIINQTMQDIEIIIVNDGSQDHGADIIREYQQKDSRIIFFDIENKGVSHARNLGLENARGEYILFIDSDDYLALDMLEVMEGHIKNSQSDMAVCNFARVFDTHIEGPYLKMPKEHQFTVGADYYPFASKVLGETMHLGGCVWNKLFHTGFLRGTQVVFEERSEIYAEDAFFYFKVLKHLRKICIIDEVLYYYYQRKTSVSNNYKPNLAPRCIQFIKELENYYQDERLNEIFAIRTFTFLIEIMHNEMQSQRGFAHFKNVITNEYLKNKFRLLKTHTLSKNQKRLYFLYRYKMIFAIYLFAKTWKGRG